MSSVETFTSRWQKNDAAERSNYALFICDLLEVERPLPSSEHNHQNDHVIDRAFTRKAKDDIDTALGQL